MIVKVINDLLKSMDGEFSIILKDLKKGKVCYEKDSGRQVPSASTIKILIMIEAYKNFLLGKLDPNGKINICDEDKVGFSLVSVMNTDSYTIRDLIVLMMTISDNTATNVLVDLLGMDHINETGAALGLEGTVLKRKMMDFEAAKQGKQNLTVPRDMLKLVEKLYKHEILTSSACEEMLGIMGTPIERDYMIRDLPIDVVCAHKPGELDGLNHDIGIVYTPTCDYALGIFATGLKDNICGRKYIAELSKEIFDHIYRLGGIE